MASAFHDQIQRPLAAMASGSDESRREMNEVQVRNMLFKGLSLTKILEASRRWHARQEAINAAISALSPELEFKNWRPGLPDWEPDGMRVTILTTRKELTDEGRDGVNDDGTAGLAHCVGGYSDRCRSGDSRILSVRRLLPSGGFVRLSTAEISVKATNGARELDVVQHRGHANGDAPPQPEAMLGEYLEKCRAGRLAINESELVPLPSSGGVMATCGYDWREPGNIEKAIAAWSPCLPRRIRGMAPEELAVPATRHDARHPSRAR
jgi:hypothetical protein